MKDWALAFVAAAFVCGVAVWCAFVLAPILFFLR